MGLPISQGNIRNVMVRVSTQYPQLRVLKYNNRVFWDNLWNPELLDFRGLVVNRMGDVIARPFKKVFNLHERTAPDSRFPIDLKRYGKFDAVIKINGFMGAATFVSLPKGHPDENENYNNRVIYSTTGSLDSDFAKMVESHCSRYESLFKQYPNHTFLFEIVDESDPHIIQETVGEYLIGCIEVASGKQWTESSLDDLACEQGIKRPASIRCLSREELDMLVKSARHEGFMVFDSKSGEMLFKLKSPYYLQTKFFARMTEKRWNALDKKAVDEEFYPIVENIGKTKRFHQLNEADKVQMVRTWIEEL